MKLLTALLFPLFLQGQVTVFNETFNSLAGWTVMGANTNTFWIGTQPASPTGNCLFVSNGSGYGYNNTPRIEEITKGIKEVLKMWKIDKIFMPKFHSTFLKFTLIWCYRMPPSNQFLRSDKPFFLKTFLAGLLFFLFHYQTVTIMCINKAF
jgi:hypothetical protein